jgi:hypothetical protein
MSRSERARTGNNQIRTKADVQTHQLGYGYSRAPAFNIKVRNDLNVWVDGLGWKGKTVPVVKAYGTAKVGDLVPAHEFSDPVENAEFWQWVENMQANEEEFWPFAQQAWEMAQECKYEDVIEDLCEAFGMSGKDWFTEGRQGGWLCTKEWGDPEEWDAITLSKWRKAGRIVDGHLEDFPYSQLWHLNVNVWEPMVERVVAVL